jgi:hypothetical protein
MRALVATLIVVAAVAAGCGGDSGSESASGSGSSPSSPTPSGSSSTPTASGLEGSWLATKAEFVSTANSSKRVDVVAKGTKVTLAFTGNSFTFTMTDPGVAPNVTTGTWTASRDTMSLTPSGMSWSWQFDMSQSGNSLTLNGANVEFDFAANGVKEQAKLYMTLARQL